MPKAWAHLQPPLQGGLGCVWLGVSCKHQVPKALLWPNWQANVHTATLSHTPHGYCPPLLVLLLFRDAL